MKHSKLRICTPVKTYWIRRLDLVKNGYNLKETGKGGGRVSMDR